MTCHINRIRYLELKVKFKHEVSRHAFDRLLFDCQQDIVRWQNEIRMGAGMAFGVL